MPPKDDNSPDPTPPLSRRSLATWLAAGTGTLAAGSAGLVGAGFLFPIPRTPPKPLFICLETEIKEGQAKEIRDLDNRKVVLLRTETGSLIALSTICTHLGCAVYWRPKTRMFECPCHQGFFDGNGNPAGGPPRAPLVRHDVDVRDGKVFVRFNMGA